MKTKICTKCGLEKSINEFCKQSNTKDGISYRCRKCYKIYCIKNSQRIKKYRDEYRNKNSVYFKEYYQKNKVKIRKYQKRYQKKHIREPSEKSRIYAKKYYRNNKEKIKGYQRIYKRELYRNNVFVRLNNNIATLIRHSLKDNKNGIHWEKLVNYTQQELRQHLEKQFTEGMTWGNYGKGNDKWQIDHKIPISLFNIASIKSKGFKQCWSLENLQPMWGLENRRKCNKLFI